ncbi:MAG: T9SS type A sorting domain-containing protein [Bacteroidales bacterium]|nr:T9SS type A sorting domain-containing protein [Bacteroidales bacterium]
MKKIMVAEQYGFREHSITGPETVEIVRSETVKHIGEGESFLNIYPNPVSSTAYIELINNNAGEGTLELYDNSGRRVTNYSIHFVAGGIELDISNLREGFYIVTLTDPASGVLQKGKMVKVAR